jgi:Uma2 family endonuclease
MAGPERPTRRAVLVEHRRRLTVPGHPHKPRDPVLAPVRVKGAYGVATRSAGSDLLLVIEIVSPGSEAMDELVKRHEYARAGIERYWVVDRDAAQTVTLYRIGQTGETPAISQPPAQGSGPVRFPC